MTIRRSALDALQIVNRRANLLQAGNLLDAMTLDKFAFIREPICNVAVPVRRYRTAWCRTRRRRRGAALFQAHHFRPNPGDVAHRRSERGRPGRRRAWSHGVLHGVTGFLAMVAIGMALPLHVVATWRHHRNHVLGATALALLAALALPALKICPRRSSA